MDKFSIEPTVNQAKTFREIAFDFGNPLDILRESISNSFDAKAAVIKAIFSTETINGRIALKIMLEDDGLGMNRDGLKAFFDLGNSLKFGKESNTGAQPPIGEKGHGTKVYFNSSKIVVHTTQNTRKYKAVMDDPFGALSAGRIPSVSVEEQAAEPNDKGTQIIILGYNNNQVEKFNHERLRDHVLWFTKFGSFEKELGIETFKDVRLFLMGLDRQQPEEMKFGHVFPKPGIPMEDLLDKYDDRAPEYFCAKFIFRGTLPRLPQHSYEAVFYVEGNKIKQEYNSMISRAGIKQPPPGAYTVRDRYGVWLCKDFIPVVTRNQPTIDKGSEFMKLHAFFNCQALRLSANRGSIEPTDEDVKNAIDEEIHRIYELIMDDEDMDMLDWLEEQVSAKKTIARERKDLKRRSERAQRAAVTIHKGVALVEPLSEVGVLAMVVQLSVLEAELLPFTIIDYDTHSGYDVIVKGDASTPIQNTRKFYVEYKHLLAQQFNHSFENLRCIVCWNNTLLQDDELKDIAGARRTMKITPATPSSPVTRYFLVDRAGPNNIEVYVLKTFLKERLGLEFKPRDGTSVR